MKEYYTIDEVQELLGRNRATVYSRIKLLDIRTHKFALDRKAYLSADDVERIKDVLVRPWIAGKEKDKQEHAA